MTSAYQFRIDAQDDSRGPGVTTRESCIRELAVVSALVQQKRHEEVRSDEEEGPPEAA